uniref:Uncharacterized protein n=1 Tax=Xiphophorus couchianus TaxID=32473 RepID=A0A3B5MI15_9TELE
MFRGDLPTVKDSRGTYFIRCSGDYILNFLRSSEVTLPCGFKETALLRKEAHFYQIEPLIQCLGDPRPLLPYPTNTYEEVAELSSTRKLSKYSNPVAVIITQLTSTLMSLLNLLDTPLLTIPKYSFNININIHALIALNVLNVTLN